MAGPGGPNPQTVALRAARSTGEAPASMARARTAKARLSGCRLSGQGLWRCNQRVRVQHLQNDLRVPGSKLVREKHQSTGNLPTSSGRPAENASDHYPATSPNTGCKEPEKHLGLGPSYVFLCCSPPRPPQCLSTRRSPPHPWTASSRSQPGGIFGARPMDSDERVRREATLLAKLRLHSCP